MTERRVSAIRGIAEAEVDRSFETPEDLNPQSNYRRVSAIRAVVNLGIDRGGDEPPAVAKLVVFRYKSSTLTAVRQIDVTRYNRWKATLGSEDRCYVFGRWKASGSFYSLERHNGFSTAPADDTWTNLETFPNIILEILEETSDSDIVIYLEDTFERDTKRSSDSGANFADIEPTMDVGAIGRSSSITWLVGTEVGKYSRDNGATWTDASTGLPTDECTAVSLAGPAVSNAYSFIMLA